MLIDLHVHSEISECSSLSLADILVHARTRGLDGVCITDHDSMAVLAQIKEGFQSDGLLVLVGMEYTTPQGDFLVYGVEAPPSPGMDAVSLMRAVGKMGGATVAAHPYREWRASDISSIIPGLCTAVEIENGRNTEQENCRAARLATDLNLCSVAGSDAHSVDELGRHPTRFSVPVRNSRDLVRALTDRQCEPDFVRSALAVAL